MQSQQVVLEDVELELELDELVEEDLDEELSLVEDEMPLSVSDIEY